MRWLLPLLLALAGCGIYDTQAARNPYGDMVGLTLPDLLACMGKPDAAVQTGPDTAILQYQRQDDSVAFKATVTLLGSIEIGGGGGCRAVFTVLRDGTVADAAFPQAHNNSLFAAPYAACGPLVDECLHHPNATSLPAGYDALSYVVDSRAK